MAGDPQWVDGRSTWRQILKNLEIWDRGQQTLRFQGVYILKCMVEAFMSQQLVYFMYSYVCRKTNIPSVFDQKYAMIQSKQLQISLKICDICFCCHLHLWLPSWCWLGWKPQRRCCWGPATRGGLLAFNSHEYDDYGRKGTSSLYVLCIFLWNLVFFFFVFQQLNNHVMLPAPHMTCSLFREPLWCGAELILSKTLLLTQGDSRDKASC